jgi:hypothetical protein
MSTSIYIAVYTDRDSGREKVHTVNDARGAAEIAEIDADDRGVLVIRTDITVRENTVIKTSTAYIVSGFVEGEPFSQSVTYEADDLLTSDGFDYMRIKRS